MESKFCRDCGRSRPVAEFAKNRASQDGLAFYCREHARRRSRASRDARLGPPTTRVARNINVPDGCKWCPDCGVVKELTEFPRTRQRSGVHTYCKPCHNARGRASLEKVGGSRTYHLQRRYGISAAEADAMLADQGGMCAICGAAPAAHVDHDHATGAVRQLLCFNCNGGLGQFQDDPERLRAAATTSSTTAITRPTRTILGPPGHHGRRRPRPGWCGGWRCRRPADEEPCTGAPDRHHGPRSVSGVRDAPSPAPTPPVGSSPRRPGRSAARRRTLGSSTDSRRPTAREVDG